MSFALRRLINTPLDSLRPTLPSIRGAAQPTIATRAIGFCDSGPESFCCWSSVINTASTATAVIGAERGEGSLRALSARCCVFYGCALSQESQKPSTTAWVLNGVCGSIKRGILQPCQKGAFVDHALIAAVRIFTPFSATAKSAVKHCMIKYHRYDQSSYKQKIS